MNPVDFSNLTFETASISSEFKRQIQSTMATI
jgi:hypothetical protein